MMKTCVKMLVFLGTIFLPCLPHISFVNNSGNYLGLTAYNMARPKTLQYTFLKRKLHYVHETEEYLSHAVTSKKKTRRPENVGLMDPSYTVQRLIFYFGIHVLHFYTF